MAVFIALPMILSLLAARQPLNTPLEQRHNRHQNECRYPQAVLVAAGGSGQPAQRPRPHAAVAGGPQGET